MKKKEIDDFIKSTNITQDQYVAPTVKHTTVSREQVRQNLANTRKQNQTIETPKLLQTIDTTQTYNQTKKNLGKADDILTQKTNILNDKEAAIYKAAGQKFMPEFKDLSKERLNYADKEKQNAIQTAIPEQKITPEEVGKQTKQEQKEYMKALNNWKIANYQNNFAKAQEKPTTLFDKTLGVPIRATQDFFSPLASDTGILRDEKGNEIYLPSYAEMRQQKVRGDTKGVAGALQDITYNTTKMADAALVDALTGGVGGKMLYWGDMAQDNYKRAKNKGYKDAQAVANTVISTGSEFLTEKLLGGVSKTLTGGKTSSVQKGLANAVNKVIKKPRVANVLGSMGAEGAEEFTQEFIDALNNKITLGEDIDLEKTLEDAIYSFAIGAGSGGAMTAMSGNIEGRQAAENYKNANNAINQLNTFKNNIADKSTIKRADEAINAAQEYKSKPFSTDYSNAYDKIKSFDEVELNALVDIASRRKAGQELTNNDMVTLQYLNSKYGTPEADIQNQPSQTTQNTPSQVEATQPNTNTQETQNVAQQPNKAVNEYQEPTARQMTPEEVEEMNRIQTESLNRMAETEGYNKETPGEQLVQNNNVSDRKVKAVQYENPEIKPYYKEMAEFIADEAHEGANMAYEGGLIQDDSGYGAPNYRRYGGWNGLLGEVDEFAKENNMTARQVEKAAQDIIEDNGKENNANAKKVEQLIDKRLRNGFTYMGDKFEPNQDYINKMEEIAFEKQRQKDLEALGDKKVEEKSIQKAENNNVSSNENINAVKETNDEYLRIDDNGNSKMSTEMPKILDEVQKEDRKVDIDTVVDTGMRLLVNKGHNIDKVAKANGINRLKTSYDRTLAVGQEGQNQIKRAQTDLRGKEYNNFKVKDKDGKITKKNLSYMGIFEDAEKSDVPTKVLEEYAVNKLNLDRRASGNEKWVEQFPNMTEEYSKKVIDDIEKLYPEIKRCHGNLTQYFANIREKMVDSGIMSKDSKEYYDMNTPNYVPIQKAVGRRGSSVSSSQNAKGVKTYNQKKIKGGNFDIQPLRETGAQFTLDTLATMRKNIVGQQLGKIIAPEYDLEAAELGENYDQETAKKLGKGEYTLTYFENGEAKTIPIDSGIYHAMTNPQISEGLKLAGELNQKYGAGLLSRAQRGLLTDKNVYFIFTNFFKDIGDAPLNSKYTAKFVKNYPSMIVDLGGKGPYSTLWKNLGGVASSYFKDGEFVGERQYKSKVGKAINAVEKGVDKALTPIEIGNSFIEQLPRLTEFKSTIEANGYVVDGRQQIENANGEMIDNPNYGELISERDMFVQENKSKVENGEMSQEQYDKKLGKIKDPTKSVDEVLDEAMYNAAEITTNFKRGGTLTKIANRNGATFLNASVQGFDKFIRNFTDVVDTTGAKPKINSKAAVKLMLKATIFGVTTSMLNDAMNGDDDDYKDIPEYQKDNYYLFKLGNHKWLRIPKGRMASIFGDAARRTKNAMTGDDKAFDGFLQQIQNQIAPNSVFTDNVLSGFSAVKNNKSWSGNKIVSDWEKNDEHPEDEYDAKTDEFSKWLGKKLGKSPKKINYLLDQYSGVVGDIALPMMTKYTNTPINSKLGKALLAPLSNKFTTSDIMSNKSQSKFYDEYNKTKDQVSHNQKIGKENDKTTIKSKYLGDQNKKLAELKTQITKVQESNMSNKEKIKQVEKLQKQINDISKKSLETSKKVKVDDYLATAGKNIYVKDDKGKWRAETDKTKEKRKELGLDVEDYYYYKKDEAFEKPDGKTVSIVDGKQAKDKMALVEAFDFDPSDYLEYEYEMGKIRGDKNAKGKTISGSAKKKVINYINGLPISKEQKIALYKKKGYKSKQYDRVVADYINNSNLTAEERESLASFLKIK